MSPRFEAGTTTEPSLTPESDGGRWLHRSAALRGLSFEFTVRCDNEPLGRHVERLLAGLQEPGLTPANSYSLSTMANGGIDLRLNDKPIAQPIRASEAVDWLLWDINRAVAEASGEHLLFHAGGVQIDGVGLIFPAPSGSGKSTLVAGLVGAGLGYLSDELIALTTSGRQLLPYPKPLSLKPGSFHAFDDLRQEADAASSEFSGAEWYLPVDTIGGAAIGGACDPKFVIVPRYAPDAATALTPLDRTEAFLALATNSVNLDVHGAAGAQMLGDLVDQCDCYGLEMSDVGEACRLVMGLVREYGDPHVP